MTARRAATRPGHQAWVGVRSLEKPMRALLNTAEESLLGRMRVRAFEVSDEVVMKEYDIHEEELKCAQRWDVAGPRELYVLLHQLGVEPEALDSKLATDYPI